MAAMTQAFAVPAPASAVNPPQEEGLQALEGFTTWHDQADGRRLARSQLRLSGMHCAACAGLIEQLLLGCTGVAAARVSPSAQRLSLDWYPERVSLQALRQRLRGAGYDLGPDLAAPARELRRKEHRQALWRWFVAGFLMMQVMMLAWPGYIAAPGEMTPDMVSLLRWGQWILTLPAMLLAAGPFFRAAWQQLRLRRLGMDVPVALGLGVAFVAGSGATLDPGGLFGDEVYFDSITMFLAFLLGGRYLELRARHRAAEQLEQASEALPSRVERLLADGSSEWVAPQQLAPGDVLRVAPGQAFGADGEVIQGHSSADEALLSGESRAVPKGPGDAVLAGSLNLQAQLLLKVQRVGAQTRLAGIEALMRQAWDERPDTPRLSDRVAGWFLVVVLVLALGAGLVWHVIDPARAVAVSVSVLIVTCPCALSLATPAAWLAAASQLARRGLLLRRLEVLETLMQVDGVVLDKTGTLSEASPGLAQRWPAQLDGVLSRAALGLAQASHHPLSQALVQALRSSIEAGGQHWAEVKEWPGQGLESHDEQGRCWRLGSPAWVAPGQELPLPQAQLVLGCEGEPLAAWRFDEQLREGAQEAVRALQARGLQLWLLSGDRRERVQAMANQLGLADWRAEQSPEDKLAELTRLQAQGHVLLMLGDGINDAPVLARAQVAVAMGQGADLAKARADAVLLGNRLDALVAAFALARRTRRVVRQNLAWAAAYNAACIPAALLGWLPPWAAGLGMALSSLLVIGNAARLGKT